MDIQEHIMQPSTSESTNAQQGNESSTASSSFGWSSWGGFLEKVKQQSESIINAYKEEIQEFTKTIETDTKEVIKKTAQEASQEKIKGHLTSGITGLLELVGGSEKEQKSVVVDRHQARVLALQLDISTYCTDPTDMDDFNKWKSNFQVSSYTDKISELLATNEKVRESHTKLVPVAVAYKDFWERYFYKMSKLEQEEERRAALVKRAISENEEEVGWDVEEEEEEEVKETEEKKEPNSKTETVAKEEVEEYFNKMDTPNPNLPSQTTEQQPELEPPQKTEKQQNKEVKDSKSKELEEDWESWE